jgi:hypothetical protein
MIIIITGDRNWRDYRTMRRLLIEEGTWTGHWFYHGACRGADMMADRILRHHNRCVESFPANWKRYGRGAGVIRNQEMLDLAILRAAGGVLVLAFHTHIEKSRGTRDMILRGMKASQEHRVSINVVTGPLPLDIKVWLPSNRAWSDPNFRVL